MKIVVTYVKFKKPRLSNENRRHLLGQIKIKISIVQLK
jgi:hypothetical protein